MSYAQFRRWMSLYGADVAEGEIPVTARPTALGLASAGPVPRPPGFGWEYPYYPVMFDNGTTVAHDVESIAVADPACYLPTAPIYYVDPVLGSDANSGLGLYPGDFSAALKSAKAAIDKVNTGNVAAQVWIKAYTDPAAACFRTPSAVLGTPKFPVLVRGIGGKVRLSTSQATYAFVQVASSTTYKVAMTATRLFDLLNKKPSGSFVELKKIPVHTANTALAAAGTWAAINESGTDYIYIRLASDAVPSMGNLRILRSAINSAFTYETPSGCCFENIIFEGIEDISGNSVNAAPRKIVFKDCEFGYGHATTLGIDSWVGMVVMLRCWAHDGFTDLYNVHNLVGTTGGVHLLLADCMGADAADAANGQPLTAQSSNGLTGHENKVFILAINTDLRRAFGAVAILIGGAQACLINCTIADGYGDGAMGGQYGPIAVRGEDFARIWMYRGIVSSCTALSTTGSAIIEYMGTITSGAISGNVFDVTRRGFS